MRYVSVTEARRHFSAILDLVKSGEMVTITSRGRPVAVISPADRYRQRSKATLLDRLRGQSSMGLKWTRDELYDV